MSLLVLLLLVPVIGAVICAASLNRRAAKTVALVFSLATLAIAVLVAVEFYSATPAAGGSSTGRTTRWR